ncbi:hypothetical protein JYK14_01455 [Siccirubricoccus sp. KC 17139]|uniref:Uncharacterized protein n=1 Tax=Siccirubricoccus soli TaxID=2899147 RepID=A0ABT1CYX4_9PROT|nr:hypothetical protein [Siccirubricoccus soli]MCO6414844.1 hypothetical protein [Siccirubricoccus soli]MCP2680974.1 hypothetical protein [Siccirubricoccus soli]
MSDFYLNMYRLIAAVVVVALFFVTARPYFSSGMRIFTCALTAGGLNAFAGGALLGSPVSAVPLRFLIAFVGIGAGVAMLEYLFPESGKRKRISTRWP